MQKLLVWLLLLCCHCAALHSAAQKNSLSYSVVSIKPTRFPVEFTGVDENANGVHIIATVKSLIGYAAGVMPAAISCDKKVCGDQLYDLQAQVDSADIAAYQGLRKEQKGLLLQPIMKERFGLEIHRRSVSVPVYLLAPAKGGVRLVARPADAPRHTTREGDRLPDGIIGFRPNGLQGYGVSLCQLARTLTVGFVESIGQPVLCEGTDRRIYDFVLSWDDQDAKNQSSGPSEHGPTWSQIDASLNDQLGLHLVPSRKEMDGFAVDHLSPLSPN
ncbi:TIGR03435 family protein [Terriglobus sp. ADX1]|uniref:TIGR03435 family protein n=1 Tax=Terriglobus sp. ADX1 TaxID=2794063 RepID=UPI002FE5489D